MSPKVLTFARASSNLTVNICNTNERKTVITLFDMFVATFIYYLFLLFRHWVINVFYVLFMTLNGYVFNIITLNQTQISYDYFLNIARTGISC